MANKFVYIYVYVIVVVTELFAFMIGVNKTV